MNMQYSAAGRKLTESFEGHESDQRKSFNHTNIYVLYDPRDNRIRYVGKTIQEPSRRLNEHIQASKGNKKARSGNWISSLLKNGVKPVMRVLEVVPHEEDWASRESFWISEFRMLGFDLTNLTSGGEGLPGLVKSTETRLKLSKAHKGKVFSEDHCRNISLSKKGTEVSEDHRKKISSAMKGRFVSEHTRLLKSIAMKKKPPGINSGENNSNSKLTREQAMEIKFSTMPVRYFVEKYKIHEGTVYDIRNGRSWK